MRLQSAPIAGAWVLDVEPIHDERGWFGRMFCRAELREHGISLNVAQMSLSFSSRAGTLRGMHYQAGPYGEVKLIRCSRGRIYDVIVDLRAGSDTYCDWFAIELSAANYRALVVPEGVAHGFQTLADDSEVMYVMSQDYVPHAERGVRWDDPRFAIDWPPAERTISRRDQGYPDFAG
jgi:dTDP-4-dehydrorhamnose 3,5-epimerase